MSLTPQYNEIYSTNPYKTFNLFTFILYSLPTIVHPISRCRHNFQFSIPILRYFNDLFLLIRSPNNDVIISNSRKLLHLENKVISYGSIFLRIPKDR